MTLPTRNAYAGDDKTMPIAIIGMGCRFPDDATSPENLWDMLIRKQSARRETPPDRFNIDAFYHPDGDKNGTMNNRGGHFLKEDISAFDAPFFSISPAEAISMDPMQRLLLEVVYEAMESSGTAMSKFAGSDTSCFVGCWTAGDYNQLGNKDLELIPKMHVLGSQQAILSNRISYFFDLQGVSLTLDTACSSGLVALHLACQSLRAGESKSAVVGGTNAILSPDLQVGMTNLHFFSPDSTCYTFDERANGYARGEGMAALILKPLDDAIRDGDIIRAVIRGTAVNSDGKTPGITLPSKEAQTALIRTAYEESGCDPAVTGYFEAHGTGTQAGDPRECGAVGATLGPHRADGEEGKLYIGSVKTNIGHLEGASGLAGMIKAVLSVEKGIIAPNLWFEKGNPKIDFDGWRIRVPTEPTPWPVAGLRRASVNSFGYGGTNAHVIIDDAYNYLRQRGLKGYHRTAIPAIEENSLLSSSSSEGSESGSLNGSHSGSSSSISEVDAAILTPKSSIASPVGKPRPRIFHIAAHEEGVTKNIAKSYAEHLASRSEENEEQLLDDLAYTLGERRSLLPFGTFVVAANKAELLEKLGAVPKAIRRSTGEPKLGFVFTGQGAQWWAMGRELLSYPVFAESLAACDKAVQSLGASWSVLGELLKDERKSRVNEAEISQPLCSAVQIALINLYASWNIHPARVVGHSSGEIACGYTSGAFSLESAMTIAYFRGLLSMNIKKRGYKGGMLAAGLSEEDANKEIQAMGEKSGKAVVACVNSPRSVTISGDLPALAQLQKILSSKGLFARKLAVDTAYHSHHMVAIAEEYYESMSKVTVTPWEERKPVQMFSSVTGKVVTKDTDLSANYWVKNLVSCVRFSDALTQLSTPEPISKEGEKAVNPVDLLIELGPHSALAGPVKQVLAAMPKPEIPIQYQSVLIRGKDAAVSALEVAASLFAQGYPLDIHTALYPSEQKPELLVDLPTYAWNHSRKFWPESRLSRDYLHRPFPRTDILGAPFQDWNPIEPRWRNFLRIAEQPWLKSHVIQGAILYPGAGYCCMALQAAAQMHTLSPKAQEPISEFKIRDVAISRALVVPETDEGIEVMFSMRPNPTNSVTSSDTWSEFRVFSYTTAGGWAEHCRGLISVSTKDSADKAAIKEDCHALLRNAKSAASTKVSSKDLYEGLHAAGLMYGPEFRGIVDISIGQGKAIGKVEVTDTRTDMPFNFEFDRFVHPSTLDTFLQLGIAALSQGDISNLKNAYVPTFIGELSVAGNISAQTGQTFQTACDARFHGLREAFANVIALEPESLEPVLRFDGIKCMAITSSESSGNGDEQSILKHLFNAVWQPDVDLLAQEDLDRILPELSSNSQIANYVSVLSHKYPDLEYLEIGAGAGETTTPVLQALNGSDQHKYPRFKSYTFTDTSSDFFEQAAKKFNSWPDFTNFKKLDIAQDPDKQEFEGERFDVIVATNLESKDVTRKIAHVRKLLRPEGKLLLLDTTQTPAQDENQWQAVLTKHGFSDFKASTSEGTRVIIATVAEQKPAVGSTDQSKSGTRVVVIRPTNLTKDGEKFLSALETTLTQDKIPTEISLLSELQNKDLAGAVCISLAELEDAVLPELTSSDLALLQQLTQQAAGLLWVTRGGSQGSKPEFSLFQGLARSVRAEQEGFPIVTVDFDSEHVLAANQASALLKNVYQQIFKNKDREFSERGGVLCIKRAFEDAKLNQYIAARTKSIPLEAELQDIWQEEHPLKLKAKTLGSLDSFVFDDDVSKLADDQVEIEVRAVGLNSRDVLIAAGETSDNHLGTECAGIITKIGSKVRDLSVGDRVAAWYSGFFSTQFRTTTQTVQRIPDNLSFSAAAALPLAYVTAYYSLIQIAHLSKGESVLIHAAAGGVGQAAIQLAQTVGAEIFVTVGSEEKKQQLIKTYGIDKEHIFSSRDLTFGRAIQRATDGQGVDVILNSLAGEALQATWECIAPFGRFIEIGKTDIDANSRLGMGPFSRNVSFTSVNVAAILRQNKKLAGQLFSKVMDLVRAGDVKEASPLAVEPFSKAKECFQQMQAGKHTGKIVLEVRRGDLVSVLPRPLEDVKFPSDASYLLAGGLGGIGRSISRWMVSHGAKNLIYVSRNGISSTKTADFIKELEAADVRISIVKCDISNEKKLSAALVETLKSMPPIRGVINGAWDLIDMTFSNMTHEAFANSIRPKVQGSWSLHKATLKQPLDFFVMLSSAAGFIGNAGQSNYVAGCTYQNALAAHRNSLGLPATSFDIGKVADVGFLAENGGTAEKNLEKLGMLDVHEDELRAIMELAMRPRGSGVSTNGHLISGIHSTVDTSKPDQELPFWSRDPVFSHLEYVRPHLNASSRNKGSADKAQVPLPQLLDSATTLSEVNGHILDSIIRKFSRSLMMPIEDIDPSKSTNAYGIDSLVGVDIRNWLARDLKTDLPVFEVLQAPSLTSLAEKVAKNSALVSDALKKAA